MSVKIKINEDGSITVDGLDKDFLYVLKKHKRFYAMYADGGFALVWDKNSVSYADVGKGHEDLYR
jgi:hypothetical protein